MTTPQLQDTEEPDEAFQGPLPSWRKVVPLALALVLLAVVAGYWFTSRLSSAYAVTSMGTIDTGGAPMTHHMNDGPSVSVTSLVADSERAADVVFELTASQGTVQLADGRQITGYAFNGTSPGPALEATVGQLVEVRVHNQNVTDGMTVHWHGVDVPNAADGVAGVTQDAIPPGGDYTYRFVAQDVGTYWYHSHQVSHEQVLGGLFGVLVVKPAVTHDGIDAIAAVHTYDGVRTINGRAGDSPVSARPGETVRVRVINTDNGAIPVWVSGAPFRVVAVDGRDLNEPGLIRDQSVLVTAGGRADLRVRVPETGGVRVQVAGASLAIGDDQAPTAPAPQQQVDFLSYGVPAPKIGFDPQSASRHFRYDIGRRPGLLDGKPGLWWTINGKMYPDVPMYMVSEGDVAVFTITNNSGQVHPMHLHGHHMLVLSRDGVAATGSPWWVDSLEVGHGQTFELAFLADNPGIWMDHCHNLPHATQGLVAHLMYEGVVTPFVIGGDHDNEPE